MATNARLNLNFQDPTIRAMIIEDYDKHGIRYTQQTYGISGRCVRKWKSLRISTGSLATTFKHCGRTRALCAAEIKKLERALLRDPFLTNDELAELVKKKVTGRAVGYYIKNSKYNFVWKLEQVDVEASFTQQHKKEGDDFLKKIKYIPLERRVYVDESFFGAGMRRRRGRYPSGTSAWTPRNRFYHKMTTISATRQHQLAHPTKFFEKAYITTKDFETYVQTDLCPVLRKNDVVIWDRLGRSGRAVNPTALHYSPAARQAIEATGASVLFLPPNGKLLNPIELLFGDIKKIAERKVQSKRRFGRPSELTFEELKSIWILSERELQEKNFIRAFKERANGQEFKRVCAEKGL